MDNIYFSEFDKLVYIDDFGAYFFSHRVRSFRTTLNQHHIL